MWGKEKEGKGENDHAWPARPFGIHSSVHPLAARALSFAPSLDTSDLSTSFTSLLNNHPYVTTT